MRSDAASRNGQRPDADQDEDPLLDAQPDDEQRNAGKVRGDRERAEAVGAQDPSNQDARNSRAPKRHHLRARRGEHPAAQVPRPRRLGHGGHLSRRPRGVLTLPRPCGY